MSFDYIEPALFLQFRVVTSAAEPGAICVQGASVGADRKWVGLGMTQPNCFNPKCVWVYFLGTWPVRVFGGGALFDRRGELLVIIFLPVG